MKSKKKIISLIIKIYIITITLITSSVNSSWTADKIFQKYGNQTIVDTNNYFKINTNEYDNIKNAFEIFEKEFNIKLYIYMIDSMDYNLSKKNPELLAEQIAYKIFGGNLTYDKNTMIILMSIKDRKNRIRTGASVKELISNHHLLNYLNNIKDDLRGENYTIAIDKLLNYIIKNLKGENYYERLFEFLSKIIIFLLAIYFVYYIINSFWTERKTVSRLERIKEITKNNISREAFIDKHCTICLEEFTKEEIEKCKIKENKKEQEQELELESAKKKEAENIINENIKNNLNYFKNESELINLPGSNSNINSNEIRRRNNVNSNINNLENENENLLNKDKDNNNSNNNNEKPDDNNFIAKLNCGHIFHSNCIDQWLSKKDACPLCKKKLNDNNDNNNRPQSQIPRDNNNNNNNNNENNENNENFIRPNNNNNENNDNTYPSKGEQNTSSNADTNNTYTNANNNTRYFAYNLAEELFDIQSIFYPSMRNYRINYTDNTFTYTRNTSQISEIANDFTSFSSSSNSGGASSSW